MKKFHIAISVANIEGSVADYSQRLGVEPVAIVPGEYALWRTDSMNFSIRQTESEPQIRHIGWEVANTVAFNESKDVNGIVWEEFTAAQQAEEIAQLWPGVDYDPAIA